MTLEEKLILRIVKEELKWALDGCEYHYNKTKHLDNQYADPDLNHYIGRKEACESILKELERIGIK